MADGGFQQRGGGIMGYQGNPFVSQALGQAEANKRQSAQLTTQQNIANQQTTTARRGQDINRDLTMRGQDLQAEARRNQLRASDRMQQQQMAHESQMQQARMKAESELRRMDQEFQERFQKELIGLQRGFQLEDRDWKLNVGIPQIQNLMREEIEWKLDKQEQLLSNLFDRQAQQFEDQRASIQSLVDSQKKARSEENMMRNEATRRVKDFHEQLRGYDKSIKSTVDAVGGSVVQLDEFLPLVGPKVYAALTGEDVSVTPQEIEAAIRSVATVTGGQVDSLFNDEPVSVGWGEYRNTARNKQRALAGEEFRKSRPLILKALSLLSNRENTRKEKDRVIWGDTNAQE